MIKFKLKIISIMQSIKETAKEITRDFNPFIIACFVGIIWIFTLYTTVLMGFALGFSTATMLIYTVATLVKVARKRRKNKKITKCEDIFSEDEIKLPEINTPDMITINMDRYEILVRNDERYWSIREYLNNPKPNMTVLKSLAGIDE